MRSYDWAIPLGDSPPIASDLNVSQLDTGETFVGLSDHHLKEAPPGSIFCGQESVPWPSTAAAAAAAVAAAAAAEAGFGPAVGPPRDPSRGHGGRGAHGHGHELGAQSQGQGGAEAELPAGLLEGVPELVQM